MTVHNTVLHYEDDILQRRHIIKRIFRDRDNVGEISWCDGACQTFPTH